MVKHFVRTLLIAFVVCLGTIAPGAWADSARQLEAETLSVSGRGNATVDQLQGVAWGKVMGGTLLVTGNAASDAVRVHGAKSMRKIPAGVLYRGNRLSFYVTGAGARLVARGQITFNVSGTANVRAVGRGFFLQAGERTPWESSGSAVELR